MTAGTNLAGAPFHRPLDWSQINWAKVTRTVRRLQARIVQATKAGRWGKVKALQRLLTHSFSGKALAVRRVTENQGKRTPGVDGQVWNTPTQKAQGIESLRQHGYQAQPLRRVYIPKGEPGSKRKRPLSIPTIKDRAMQALYKLALDPIAETTGDPNSYGFRRERSPADAIGQCFLCFRQRSSPTAVLDADIQGCFETISHEWLLEHIPLEKGILKQWLKAGYIDRHVFTATTTGVPQGGPICPTIANLTLDGLEAAAQGNFPRSLRRQQKIHLIRFADDFIATGSSQTLLETAVKPRLESFLAERGLRLSPEKTRVTTLQTGFDFLGQTVRTYQGKLLIKPAKKRVKAFLTKLRTIIHQAQHLTADQLNPLIRGWVNYHRHVVSNRTFHYIDYHLFRALWQWAKRRHRTKSNRWIFAKYFKRPHQRSARFHAQVLNHDGSPRTLFLLSAGRTRIERHIKIKAAANPFDPAWEPYFERRLDRKMAADLAGRQTLLTLWRAQNGRCPVCHQKITKLTGWANHHIIYRVHGGQDTLDNRLLLHPTCHQQVHSLGLSVSNRVPPRGV
jgi:RNA-directed DNA polymerase